MRSRNITDIKEILLFLKKACVKKNHLKFYFFKHNELIFVESYFMEVVSTKEGTGVVVSFPKENRIGHSFKKGEYVGCFFDADFFKYSRVKKLYTFRTKILKTSKKLLDREVIILKIPDMVKEIQRRQHYRARLTHINLMPSYIYIDNERKPFLLQDISAYGISIKLKQVDAKKIKIGQKYIVDMFLPKHTKPIKIMIKAKYSLELPAEDNMICGGQFSRMDDRLTHNKKMDTIKKYASRIYKDYLQKRYGV